MTRILLFLCDPFPPLTPPLLKVTLPHITFACAPFFITCALYRAVQLLARLVRDYGNAGRFITAGGASSLLALPGASSFEGSTSLLAVVFR